MKRSKIIKIFKVIWLSIEFLFISLFTNITAFFLIMAKMHKAAERFLIICQKVFPKYKDELWDMLAYNSYKSNDLIKAAEYYEKYINESSVINILHFIKLGKIYEIVGKYDLAIKVYENFIDYGNKYFKNDEYFKLSAEKMQEKIKELKDKQL